MKKKFKWRIIGTGGIANAFAHDLQYLNNHVVESVLSRDMKTAKKFSSNYKGCKPFNKEKLFFKIKILMLSI